MELGGVIDDWLSGIGFGRAWRELFGRSLVRISSETISSAKWGEKLIEKTVTGKVAMIKLAGKR